jgi:hypothetical protein
MTLWRRAPRAVYSVYGEDEYLSGGSVNAVEEGAEEARPSAPVVAEVGRASWSARLIGLGLLAGITVGAIALVLAQASHLHTSHSRVASTSRVRRVGSARSVGNDRSNASGNRLPAAPVPTAGVSSARMPKRVARLADSPGRGHVATLAEYPRNVASGWAPRAPRSPMSQRSYSDETATLIGGEFDFER